MRHILQQVAKAQIYIALGMLLCTAMLTSGCGGKTTSSSSSSTGTSSTTTTDMGTMMMPGTIYQYQLKNAASGLVLGVSGQSQAAGASIVQEDDTSSTDSMWHFAPSVYSTDETIIENMLTHEVMGFSASAPTSAGLPSTSSVSSEGAQALQDSDTGTDDQDWVFYLLTDGNYLIKNHYSGLYLEDENSDTTTSATITQGSRSSSSTGCTCQEWKLVKTTTAAYPSPITVNGTGIYVHDPYMLQDPTTHDYWLYGTHQTIAYATSLSDSKSNTFTYTTASTPYGACTTADAKYWLSVDSHCPIIAPDLSSWSGLQTPPSDNSGENTDIWAPSLMYENGVYYQYYSIPVEPDTVGGEAIIGLATSATPYGPWTDKGWIIQSWSNTTNTPLSGFGFVAGTTYNAIDPAPFVDASGNWWMAFGSWFDGTHLIQLDPSSGTRLSSNTTMTSLAFRYWGEEGSFIYPYVFNGTQYYYYFASINACCSEDSTYRIIMGRATNPTGPYYDRAGNLLTKNGGTILLSTHSNIVGPGGQSVFTDTGADGTQSLPTLVYHYYDGNNSGTDTLGINRLGFTSDGWPYVE
jgi:arabinan endo-1,5-alpha-L-arabinosidase